MITVIDKKRMIRHTKTKGSIYIRNLRYKKDINNNDGVVIKIKNIEHILSTDKQEIDD